MDAIADKAVEDSTPPVVPSVLTTSTPDLSDQQPKRLFKMNKLVATLIGLMGLVALFIGYLVFINPLPLYVIPVRILGLKLGYKFYDDPRKLVYFLYPKEGKVAQEANGTVVWKKADESGDNAVATLQLAKDPMPSSGCEELDKNIWECSGSTDESGNTIYSYYVTQSNKVYLVNLGTKQSGSLKLARAGDDIFFARVLQSLLISPNQSPVMGNVEFMGHEIELPLRWTISNTTLVLDGGLFNEPISNFELINDDYSINFSGPLSYGRGNCDTAILKRDEAENLSITYDNSIAIYENNIVKKGVSSGIFRVDIINSIDRNKYLSSDKKGDAKYSFGLCMPNTDPDASRDSLESGSMFGKVSYAIPQNFDPKILEEMDGIIKDLTKKGEEPRQELNGTSFGEVCERIQTISSETYELCEDGRVYQLKKSNKIILNHLSRNYSVSPDKTKMVIWRFSDQYYNDCAVPPGGCGGASMHIAYMVDMMNGNFYQLIESQDRPLWGEELKVADSVWSPDNKGILLVNFDGIYYCSTTCKFIVKTYCVAGCSSAYFKNGKINYTDSYEDNGGELAIEPKLKSIDWQAK